MQEQDERRPAEAAGDRRPADEHGHAAGDAAPHDVLRRAALEDEAVEDDVEQDRAERQRRGEPVREEPEPGDGCRAEGVREHERLAVGELAGDERATLGALHDAVDVAVDVAVERARGARAHGAADERGDERARGSAGRSARGSSSGAVTTSSSSMTRGLVSARYAAALRRTVIAGRDSRVCTAACIVPLPGAGTFRPLPARPLTILGHGRGGDASGIRFPPHIARIAM